jgi:hypothetical protein
MKSLNIGQKITRPVPRLATTRSSSLLLVPCIGLTRRPAHEWLRGRAVLLPGRVVFRVWLSQPAAPSGPYSPGPAALVVAAAVPNLQQLLPARIHH